MQNVLNIISSMEIECEITMFLSSLALYLILHLVRKARTGQKPKSMSTPSFSKTRIEHDASSNQEASAECGPEAKNARYVQIDKALRIAFEAEDYWEVLKCWNKLKFFDQCPPILLSQIVKSMQCCNKNAMVIVAELRNFFKAHPKKRNISIINDILEPLARRLDDPRLVDMIVKMIPSVHLVKDFRTHEILLTMHVARQDFAEAQEVIAEMRTNEVAFTPCATVAVLTIALQLNNLEVALKAFSKLETSWDVRSTWAVSPFALQRHKACLMTRLVELSREQSKLEQLMPVLMRMVVPAEVMDCLDPPSKALLSAGAAVKKRETASDASTSEGSRSDDSEVGEED